MTTQVSAICDMHYACTEINVSYSNTISTLRIAVNVIYMQPICPEAAYTLEIRAHHYWNPDHHMIGGCCEWFNCADECDNRFKFCLRGYEAHRDGNENNCPLGSYSTGEIGNDGFSFGSSQIDKEVSNPMTFEGNIWGVSIYNLIQVL